MTADSVSAVPRPPARPSAPEITGAEAVVRSLELLGVTDVFGLPGGAILPVYDPLMDASQLRHILVRHEQGAGHAAEGYASASGKVGVCIATSGPGATNLVTAIADAYMDSVPLLAITGQVFSTLMGTDAFQEADIVGITMPITKHSFLVKDAADIPGAIAAAYEIAGTGRPGPVLVDITKDAQQATAPFVWPPKIDLPGYRPVTKAHGKQIQAAAALLAEAKKPVLYVGGGVVRGRAAAELLELAESTGAPVVTTLMARGAFPDSHPQHLGMPGMHGTVPAVLALQEADLLVSLGARFDDRVTGKAALFAPHAKVVHVDIDPAEISKIRTADVPIVGDVRDVLTDLDAAFRGATADAKPDIEEWWSYLDGLRNEFPLGYAPTTDGLLAPQYVIQRIGELTGPEGIFASGVGQHQMWAAQFIKYERPNAWLNSGGAGTMGYSVPAAMGAKVAEPERQVWAIDGDGCFQMTNQELATCAINNIPIKVAIINNSSLGMVRQWQTLFYDGRHSNTDLNTGHGTIRIPDFVKLAEAYGCLAIRVEKEEEVDAAIQLALETNDRPVVIDFVVSADSMVWPMVPQGVSNSYVQYARDHAPAFDEED
ncbi:MULTISPECIES: acetolactate synthase large subunit [Microbacterium]|jgi:acetolactate synthase I/II/III large subunit|uniref:acetolactate synthase large subunit n=1 Tax=Microbacterium TaxID=33882 RepID=UPI00046A75B7|nr:MULTISPECIES: acetolactate synthase large subunit [Microbacterium]AMG84349.1 acetolactate synthase 1 catalytic subunit [Microbacterium sp. PAMC 28756]AVL96963.1 acetolactate synthase large subunit [Microbacterium sp. str. 'China']KYJ99311.1 acetolactate synthase 1 catalytic subunit [Microbacterium sp. CH1]MCK2031449.1 acetolactate synthase large subunit [Microbacterium sp. KSW4-4]MCT1394177.1 acetolactate synthase large subunit [Microbacterium sp. p3-SID338]